MQFFQQNRARRSVQVVTMATLEALRPFVLALVESFLEGSPSSETPTIRLDFGEREVRVNIPPELLERWQAIKERMQRLEKDHEG